MKIISFIKKELSGWSKAEIILCAIFLLFVLGISLWLKDSKVATASAIFGFLYTFLAGKGKISCFFFGLQGTLCYSYLSLENALFGNLLLYLGYYFPMQVLGIFKWKKNLDKKNKEIKKTKLSNKERFIFFIFSIIASLIFAFVLKYFGGKNPFLDAAATVFSLLGMYLTVRRCIEQWVVWTIVNAIMVFIWLNIFIHGGNTFATLLMWSAYLFLGIYFFFKWKKEIRKNL